VRAVRVAKRGGIAVVVVLCPVVGLAAPAHADTGTPPAVSTAWYWAEKTAATPLTTLPTLPDQANPASGVPDGDLGVGYVTDQAAAKDKTAAVDVDLTAIPLGAVFSSFQLTMPVDASGDNVGTADISACENIDAFTESVAPQDIGKAPPYAQPTCVKGVRNAANAYVFDLTAVANDWSQGTPADGVSVVPTLLASADMRPFSLALKGKNAIITKAVWSPPVTDPAPAPQAPQGPNVPAVAPPPLLGQGGNLPPMPEPQAPAPQALPQVPQPQTQPAPQAVAIRPAGFAPRSLVPSTQWWLAVLSVAALLGLAWITQSDPLVPVPADPRRTRFARAVRSA
jgi:hypothetical protein